MAALAHEICVFRSSEKAGLTSKCARGRFDAALFLRSIPEGTPTPVDNNVVKSGNATNEKPHDDGVYSSDYHADLLKREVIYHVYKPDSPYLRYRKLLIEFLYEIGRYCRLSPLSVPLAVQYLDRILSKSNVAEKYLYLVTSCCSLIAAKFSDTEDRLPKISDLDEWCAGEYTCDLIRTHEAIFVDMLGWHLHSVTPMHLVLYYLSSKEFVESLKLDGHPTNTITCHSSNSKRQALSEQRDNGNSSRRKGSNSKKSKNDGEQKASILNPIRINAITAAASKSGTFGPLAALSFIGGASNEKVGEENSSDDTTPMDERALKRVQKEMRSLCHFFAENYIQEYDFQQYVPSIVASAIVASSRRVLGFSRVWPLSLETLTTRKFYDISLCEAKMYRLYQKKRQAAAKKKKSKSGHKSSSTDDE